MSEDVDRRCRACGALVSPDAEWCGQCFTPLAARTAVSPEPEAAGAPVDHGPTASPDMAPSARREPATWPCTVCGAENAIVLDVCETCGTPFASVMRGDLRRTVDAEAAFRRSLLFPGAGHSMLGYGIDGFARGALFVLGLGIGAFLYVATPHTGVMVVAILLSLALAIAMYALSAVECRELAAGGRLRVPSRVLLWVGVGVVFATVGLIGLSIATSAPK